MPPSPPQLSREVSERLITEELSRRATILSRYAHASTYLADVADELAELRAAAIQPLVGSEKAVRAAQQHDLPPNNKVFDELIVREIQLRSIYTTEEHSERNKQHDVFKLLKRDVQEGELTKRNSYKADAAAALKSEQNRRQDVADLEFEEHLGISQLARESRRRALELMISQLVLRENNLRGCVQAEEQKTRNVLRELHAEEVGATSPLNSPKGNNKKQAAQWEVPLNEKDAAVITEAERKARSSWNERERDAHDIITIDGDLSATELRRREAEKSMRQREAASPPKIALDEQLVMAIALHAQDESSSRQEWVDVEAEYRDNLLVDMELQREEVIARQAGGGRSTGTETPQILAYAQQQQQQQHQIAAASIQRPTHQPHHSPPRLKGAASEEALKLGAAEQYQREFIAIEQRAGFRALEDAKKDPAKARQLLAQLQTPRKVNNSYKDDGRSPNTVARRLMHRSDESREDVPPPPAGAIFVPDAAKLSSFGMGVVHGAKNYVAREKTQADELHDIVQDFVSEETIERAMLEGDHAAEAELLVKFFEDQLVQVYDWSLGGFRTDVLKSNVIAHAAIKPQDRHLPRHLRRPPTRLAPQSQRVVGGSPESRAIPYTFSASPLSVLKHMPREMLSSLSGGLVSKLNDFGRVATALSPQPNQPLRLLEMSPKPPPINLHGRQAPIRALK